MKPRRVLVKLEEVSRTLATEMRSLLQVVPQVK